MDVSLFDYNLPTNLIAQEPLKERSQSKLLVLNKDEQTINHHHFFEIDQFLKSGDVLVRNNTKVIPARLFAVKETTQAKVEILLLEKEGEDIYLCLVGNAKTIQQGTKIIFEANEMIGQCLEVRPEGLRLIKFIYQGDFYQLLDKWGHMPLPPYIHHKLKDKDRYQTTYAQIPGSAAAPTAGFHFTDAIFKKLKEKGVIVVDVTLQVGLATFRPVKVDQVEHHQMHYEHYQIDALTAEILNKAKLNKQRIIAIGTTVVRTLEANYQKYNQFKATSEATNLFIYPGFIFNAVDAIITNFHLPKSTLFMMMASFTSVDFLKKTYMEAIANNYRFFSFGDAMFVYGNEN